MRGILQVYDIGSLGAQLPQQARNVSQAPALSMQHRNRQVAAAERID
jgi:hypothetical protein